VSEALSREVVSLPLYPELEEEEVEAVIAAVRDACARLASPS
jgi:dTDP-4-amino-4,6-dideoxygalactose transaminase